MANKTFLKNISRGIRNKVVQLLSNPYKEINLNWFKIKFYKHLPAGKIKKHLLFGKPLFFTDSIQLVSGLEEIFIEKSYFQKLQETPFIIDCGANIGLSVIYMKRQYPNAEIIAFEPDETNFHLLSENIKSFGFNKVTLCKQAVWIENKVLKFSNESSMSSKIDSGNGENSIKVNAIKLKDILVRDIDFLKIDIEGAEYEVLKDIENKLYLVQNLFIEYHGTFEKNAELVEMLDIINKSGFKFYIKEAAPLYDYPFYRIKKSTIEYDVQLNIFCFRL